MDAVWFSTNPVYDAAACRYGTTALKRMIKCGAETIRFLVDMPLTSWSEHKKTSGILPVMARGLEKAGMAVGSNPKDWYLSYEPVKEWLAIEAYRDGKWVKVRGDKSPSEKCRKTRRKIQTKSKATSKVKGSSTSTAKKTPVKKLVVNKLWNENCLLTLRRLPSNSIELVVTSPPYDNLRSYAGLSFSEFMEIAKELHRVLKHGGVILWIVGDGTEKGSETGTSFRQALYFMELGLRLHDTMIYEKSGFAFPEKNRYHQTFEYMFVFSKGRPKTFNAIKDRPNKCVGFHGGEQSYRAETGMRFNIWRYANGGNHNDTYGTKHPAPLPEALARDLIVSFSNPGDVVYDCFGGGGTVAVESMLLGRNWITSEISAEYCKMIEKRFKLAKARMLTAAKRSSKKGGNLSLVDPACGSGNWLKMVSEMAKKSA
jgi:site-specific DNA-methyltransferase (adenine-specific)